MSTALSARPAIDYMAPIENSSNECATDPRLLNDRYSSQALACNERFLARDEKFSPASSPKVKPCTKQHQRF
jgi:hypothetical protein